MDEAEVSRQVALLTRGAEHVVRPEELAERLRAKGRLRVKLGVDPTARDVTLGWAVPLTKLRQFQDQGHTAVLIIGDFTARIGDPSGKSDTRPRLSAEEVRANAEACVASLLQILSEDNLEVRYNSEWLAPLDLAAILELTAHYTVAQMLERDDFAKRYEQQRPISIIEFMYPLCQGYDSVAVQADVELGGTDQLFNLLVGRDLQRAYGQEPQIALTMPLLVGLDGVNKMSQSLGNYVGIAEAPEEMFGKLMSIPDRLVGQYALLAAWLPDDEVAEVSAQVAAGGPGAGQGKRRVARAVVARYHGEEAAAAAEAAFDRVFVEHGAPENLPQAAIPQLAVEDGRLSLVRALPELGLASSRGEARRLLAGGGVKLNGRTVTEEWVALEAAAGAIVQVGRRRFVRLAG